MDADIRAAKLANVLFARAVARRLSGSGVTANALHSGNIDGTNIAHVWNRDTLPFAWRVFGSILGPLWLLTLGGLHKTTVAGRNTPQLFRHREIMHVARRRAYSAIVEVLTGDVHQGGVRCEVTSDFDGKTLTGWNGDPLYWRVDNGLLVG